MRGECKQGWGEREREEERRGMLTEGQGRVSSAVEKGTGTGREGDVKQRGGYSGGGHEAMACRDSLFLRVLRFSAELCPPAGHERIPAHLMATSSTPLPLGEEEETPETQEFGGRHEGNCLTDESGAIAAVLPGIDGVDILALGNQIQPRYRPHTEGGEGGERGQSLVVATLQLIDHERRSTPWVSRLHAEVFFKGESLFLVSVGKSFSFVNEVPIHADDPRFDKQMRLYDQDELRFGGNLTGKTGGCYSKFVFHVNCPSLGKRPPPDC